MVSRTDKENALDIALSVASKSQSIQFTAKIMKVSELDREFYQRPQGGWGLAFTRSGFDTVYINKSRLYSTGSDEVGPDEILMLVQHETGHLSLSPIFTKGEMLEFLAIIYQPERNVRLPVTLLKNIPLGNFQNLYSDSIINYKILNNPYIEKSVNKEHRLSTARGMIKVYEGFGVVDGRTKPPSIRKSVFMDVGYQAARKVLAEEGIDPYESEGWTRKNVLNKLDELNFKFSDSNRPAHNAKVADYIWFLRFEEKCDDVVEFFCDGTIKNAAVEEEKMRTKFIDYAVVNKFADTILTSGPNPYKRKEITPRLRSTVEPQARDMYRHAYDTTFNVDMVNFSKLIGIKEWKDVEDEVIGGGAVIP